MNVLPFVLLVLLICCALTHAWWSRDESGKLINHGHRLLTPSSKSALANLADANGCVQLAACYNDAHEKVLECEILLKDLERKEADEEKRPQLVSRVESEYAEAFLERIEELKEDFPRQVPRKLRTSRRLTCSKIAKNMERARDIKQQQLRIEAMQKCYKEYDMEDAETKSKTQKKCARTFMKLAQESEDRHNAEASAVPSKRKGLHKNAIDDYERWATKVDQCLRQVGALRTNCKPLIPCCPAVKQCKSDIDTQTPDIVKDLTKQMKNQQAICKKQKQAKISGKQAAPAS